MMDYTKEQLRDMVKELKKELDETQVAEFESRSLNAWRAMSVLVSLPGNIPLGYVFGIDLLSIYPDNWLYVYHSLRFQIMKIYYRELKRYNKHDRSDTDYGARKFKIGNGSINMRDNNVTTWLWMFITTNILTNETAKACFVNGIEMLAPDESQKQIQYEIVNKIKNQVFGTYYFTQTELNFILENLMYEVSRTPSELRECLIYKDAKTDSYVYNALNLCYKNTNH